MKLINTINSNMRTAATLLAGLDEEKVVKIVETDKAYRLSLENGLSFTIDILDKDEDDVEQVDSTPFYVNAKYLGSTLVSCMSSDYIAMYRVDGKLRIGGYINEETNQFTFEAEFECIEPFADIVFGDVNTRFVMSQSDIVEMFGLCDMFLSVDICRTSGTLSYRTSNGTVTAITKFNLSNKGVAIDSDDFKINVNVDTLKLLSFIGYGEVVVELDYANKLLRADDGNMSVVARYDDYQFDSIMVKNANAVFNADKKALSGAIKELCGSLQSIKGNDLIFNPVVSDGDTSYVAIDWNRKGIGEISILTAVKESKEFAAFSVPADILAIAINCSEDSFVTFCRTDAGENVILCENSSYLRKILF